MVCSVVFSLGRGCRPDMGQPQRDRTKLPRHPDHFQGGLRGDLPLLGCRAGTSVLKAQCEPDRHLCAWKRFPRVCLRLG